ncbi:MAG: NAD(P)/FAD-dependent oxidoreductase [Rhodospirillaceae bacterium]|nr:NAD(P)/FAD-dependent oxidoreductase [Rhodospirillaceae bacterium]
MPQTAEPPGALQDGPAEAQPTGLAGLPQVVVIGAGFAGLFAAVALAKAPVEVVVIDRRNHHLFQPLLYQVATAGLSPADIAQPIRSILARQANARVVLGRVTGIDRAARQVVLGDVRVPYDHLVVATGARDFYFGHQEWEPVAPGLKTLEDAIDIRRRILVAFEKAEALDDAAERERLLTFVVIGGGATGVEMAGAIAELAKTALKRDFRRIDSSKARIILVEAGPRLLPAYPERLSASALRSLEKLGVEVRLGAPVTKCSADGVDLPSGLIPARTIVWAAGVQASPAGKWLGVTGDRVGRIEVGHDLSLPGEPEIFVVGDTALVRDAEGRPLPGTAPVAKQQGRYVGRLIANRLRGKAMKPFRYHHIGSLATIGRKSAVADFGRVRLQGRIAWLLWGIIHIYFLIGFRNRLVILLDWLWAYITFQRGARLITGSIK